MTVMDRINCQIAKAEYLCNHQFCGKVCGLLLGSNVIVQLGGSAHVLYAQYFKEKELMMYSGYKIHIDHENTDIISVLFAETTDEVK